jgi:hypothetical protein
MYANRDTEVTSAELIRLRSVNNPKERPLG